MKTKSNKPKKYKTSKSKTIKKNKNIKTKTTINTNKTINANKTINPNKTINANKNTFQGLRCAPRNDDSKKLLGISCYTDDDLKLMKKSWNESSNNKITTNSPDEIWKFFKENLKNSCYNEVCWLNHNNFKDKINKKLYLKSVFRPYAPNEWLNKPYAWLSSVDIVDVIKQYENKYNNFVFIGPSPIDFDDKKLFGTCVWEKLCKFDLRYYLYNNPKKNKIGIIFNTDPHYKAGQHWVALFIDVDKEFIFYFDSNGDKILHRIKLLVDRIILQAKDLNIDLKFESNYGLVHQKRDGQCGMYCLYFIIELLKERKNIDYFKNNRISDEEMKEYRFKYFNYK